MNFIESISRKGIKSTSGDAARARLTNPRPGDIVEFDDGKRGRVDSVGPCSYWEDKDKALICMEMGSAFMDENGTLQISGGPFKTVKITDLEPTFRVGPSRFWNWGDNQPRAHMSVEFVLDRPIFKLASSD
jgi:uncharacterized protein YkvS